MKAILYGGGGFIGKHLAQKLIDCNYEVTVIGRSAIDNKTKDNHIYNYTTYIQNSQASIQQIANVFTDADVVYHLASTMTPSKSNENILGDIEENLNRTIRFLDVCLSQKVRRVVFISSGGTVYGIPKQLPITETHMTDPICSYGIVKLAIEKYLHLYYHLYGLDYRIIRLSNPYGPMQNLLNGLGAVSVFIDKVLKKEPITIWGDGSVIRDYIYIDDVVSALTIVATSNDSNKIYNIGCGIGHSLCDLINTIELISKCKADVIFAEHRNVDVPYNVLDVTLARNCLNWSPAITLEEGIGRLINYLSL
jgi:UDP-glucose 4-epimerase